MLIADYHTHTVYSHGKGTIEENVRQAEKIGLAEIAITDHGLNHVVLGLKRRKIDEVRRIIGDCNNKYEVKTLFGIEANIVSKRGDIDVKESEIEKFDIILAGYHKAVWGKKPLDFFTFILKNDTVTYLKFLQTDRSVVENTKTYIKAIEKNPIDIITHINHDMLVDPIEVAKAARDNGTYLEISAKKEHLPPELLYEVSKTGVNFIINSDAHTVGRVGEFKLGIDTAEIAGIPKTQIANYGKLPQFLRYKR